MNESGDRIEFCPRFLHLKFNQFQTGKEEFFTAPFPNG